MLRVTSRDLLLENKRLKQQLAEARAAIADRDAKIEKLARDLAKLEALVTQLLAQRRGGHSVPEGQGLLFPESGLAIDAPKTEGIATDESVDAAAADKKKNGSADGGDGV